MFRKTIYFIFILLLNTPCFAKDESYGPEQFWNKYTINIEPNVLDKTDRIDDFLKYNFSKIWMTHQDAMIGFIGENYQRFFIHFSKIQKSKDFSYKYLVSGKTKVKNNINKFTGEITLEHIFGMNKTVKDALFQECKKALKTNDRDFLERYKQNRFMVVAKYVFHENSNQYGSGELTGVLRSYFYIEKGKIFYDALDLGWSDGYANNLFIGTWNSYGQDNTKKCNFGNFRIPYSGDLDIGAGEFSPRDKYLSYGWDNYRQAYTYQDKQALNEEERPWW